jgi:hypothetical protein
LSSISVGPTGTTQRKVYRTLVNGSVFYLLRILVNNTTTSFLDNSTDFGVNAIPYGIDVGNHEYVVTYVRGATVFGSGRSGGVETAPSPISNVISNVSGNQINEISNIPIGPMDRLVPIFV